MESKRKKTISNPEQIFYFTPSIANSYVDFTQILERTFNLGDVNAVNEYSMILQARGGAVISNIGLAVKWNRKKQLAALKEVAISRKILMVDALALHIDRDKKPLFSRKKHKIHIIILGTQQIINSVLDELTMLVDRLQERGSIKNERDVKRNEQGRLIIPEKGPLELYVGKELVYIVSRAREKIGFYSSELAVQQGGMHLIESGYADSTYEDPSDQTAHQLQQPFVNVDGSPMIGSVDVHGRAFGAVDDNQNNNGFGNSGF